MTESFFHELEEMKYQLRTGTLSNEHAFILFAIFGVIFGMVSKKMPLLSKKQVPYVLIGGVSGVLFNKFTQGTYKAKQDVFKEKGFDDDTAYIVSGQQRM